MSNSTPRTDSGLQISSKSKTLGYYSPAPTSLSVIPEDVISLLQHYSGIREDEILSHIISTRDALWDIFPWPCIGQFRFLDLSFSKQPSYDRILALLRSGNDRMIDVGCCLAQDLRKLAYDGAPSSSLFGIEIEPRFVEMGYDFFKDRDSPSFRDVTLIRGDFLDKSLGDMEPISALMGSFGIVHVGMVLHIFDWEGQIAACGRLVEFLRDEKGSMIVGQSVGDLEGKEVYIPGRKKHIFKHNVETFKEMWMEIGRRHGTQWDVRAKLDEGLGIAEGKRDWDQATSRRLAFEVERV